MAPKRPLAAGAAAARDVSSEGDQQLPESGNHSSPSPAKAASIPLDDEDDHEIDHLDEDATAGSASESEIPNPHSLPEATPNSAPAAGADNEEEEEDVDDGMDDGIDGYSDDPTPVRRPSRGGPEVSIKPISSRPMDGSPLPKPKSAALGSGFASNSRNKKRRSASSARVASRSGNHSDSAKRPNFQRLWSHDDEVAVLRGLNLYISKKGSLPASTPDIEALHRLIRTSLSVSVTTVQLSDKIRRLKKKFLTVSARGRGGKDPAIADPHDQIIFDLSKKVWGRKNGVSVAKNVSQQSNEEGSEQSDGGDGNLAKMFVTKKRRIQKVNAPNSVIDNGAAKRSDNGREAYPYLWEAVDELSKEQSNGAVFAQAFGVLEDSKARAMEDKMRKFRLMELRQKLRKSDLMKETLKMILDALEKSD